MKFGENLYNLRKSAKLSQEKLAEQVGVSRQSVSKWENGESYPEMDKILKLCNIFHCKINDLVHEDLVDIDSLDEDVKMSVVKFKAEKQKKMKGLSKAIYILARIGKICVTIGIPCVVIAMMVIPYIANNVEVVDGEILFKGSNANISIIEQNMDNDSFISMSYHDSEAVELDEEETLKIKEILENNSTTKIIIYVEAGLAFLIVNLVLVRQILKNLENLFVNINNGDTPFTLENVKHIKQMAYLMIATIILPNVSGAIFEIIMRTDLNIEFEAFDIVEILFLFSMAYIFEYGYELQLDSNSKMYGEVEADE